MGNDPLPPPGSVSDRHLGGGTTKGEGDHPPPSRLIPWPPRGGPRGSGTLRVPETPETSMMRLVPPGTHCPVGMFHIVMWRIVCCNPAQCSFVGGALGVNLSEGRKWGTKLWKSHLSLFPPLSKATTSLHLFSFGIGPFFCKTIRFLAQSAGKEKLLGNIVDIKLNPPGKIQRCTTRMDLSFLGRRLKTFVQQ